MPIPACKPGTPVESNKRPVKFSYWPTRSSPRAKQQNMLYVHDPWGTLESYALNFFTTDHDYKVSTTFLTQAKEYFTAGHKAARIEAQPLLYYYSFLNLIKFCLSFNNKSVLKLNVYHGQKPVDIKKSITSAELSTYSSSKSGLSAFDELLKITGSDGISAQGETLQLDDIMPQLLVGHRLWCEAKNRNEHFVAIDRVEILENKTEKRIWLRIIIADSDLAQTNQTSLSAIRKSGLENSGWRRVRVGGLAGAYCFEMEEGIRYTHRPIDKVSELCLSLRKHCHRLISSTRPYRRYYLKLYEPQRELGQLGSSYALLFYLGSIARYRPSIFLEILSGSYGSFVREQLSILPSQLLFELSSIAKMQEISKGSVVNI